MRKILMSWLLLAGIVLAGVARADGSPPASGSLIYRVYVNGGTSPTLPVLEFSYSDGRPPVTVAPCANAHPVLAETALFAGYTPAVPACAWMMIVDASNFFTNIAYPDTAAVYWVTNFQLDPALTITVRGNFPEARYMSFNVYDGAHSSYVKDGLPSGLADYLIAPDAGSVNPWQQPAAAGGGFTVRVVPAVLAGGGNQIPMPDPVASTGAGLPPPCQGQECPPALQFSAPASTGGLAPNVDNAYVAALFQPLAGQVLVVRGRMPTVQAGYQATHPSPWPGSTQLRYWSLCDNEYQLPYPVVVNTAPDGSVVEGCVADYQAPLDAGGNYTAVVSAPEDRPRNADTAHGVAWLPQSAQHPLVRHMLIMRNMLPEQFPQAIQYVPADNNPASAAAVMQDYYPQIYRCARSVYELGGWQACAAH